MTTLVELCCGTAAVSLWAMGRLKPLTGFMGSKQRDAARLCSLLGARDPSRVLLVDGGPWGIFWQTIAEEHLGHLVADFIDALEDDGPEIFDELAAAPAPCEPIAFSGIFACLQSANGRGRAVQVEGDRWITHGYAHLSRSGRALGFGERLDRRRLAARIRHYAGIRWPRVRVLTGDLRTEPVTPTAGDLVYVDAPYAGTTGYHARDLDRPSLIRLASSWAESGATVATSERRPLAWAAHAVRVAPTRSRARSAPEWLIDDTNRVIAVLKQDGYWLDPLTGWSVEGSYDGHNAIIMVRGGEP